MVHFALTPIIKTTTTAATATTGLRRRLRRRPCGGGDQQRSLLAILKMFDNVYACVGREKDERIHEQTRLIEYLTRRNDLRQNTGD